LQKLLLDFRGLGKYFIELTKVLVLNDLINSKSNSFKSASNTFLPASLVYIRQQQIYPIK
jgi:hypothetical protein